MPVSNYFAYYDRILQVSENGLKLVVGGTGLGKTSAIVEVVKQYPDHKFIYIANRRRLLREMESQTRYELPAGSVIHIRPDFEQVYHALHTDGLDDLLETDYARQAERESGSTFKREDIRRTLQRIRRLSESDIDRGDQYEVLKYDARTVMRFFRLLVSAANGQLANSQSVLDLFPLMQLGQPGVNFAIVTLQKLFYGVFDGERDVDLSSLRDTVIFLDEFDFLEQDLLNLLSEAPEIENLFEFVAPFYRVMRNRLQSEHYAQDQPELKKRLADIIHAVEDLQEKLSFPDYTQCFLAAGAHLHADGVQIFRTNHTVAMQPLRIWRGDRGFEIASAFEVGFETGYPLAYVLGRLHNISRRIMTLLKEYKARVPSIYEELRTQCYHQPRSTYYDVIERIGQFPGSELPSHTGFDSLMASGFNLYDVQYLGHSLDPEAVEVRSLAMYATPERILYDLTTKNLVFGLSATGDIERVLNHFDLRWLREQQAVRWHALSSDDYDLVKKLNEEKFKRRSSRVYGHLLEPLQNKDLRRIVKQIADEPGFAKGKTTTHHEERLESFFALLEGLEDDAAGTPSQLYSHLVFVSSYRQIKLLFDSDVFRHVPDLYEIEDVLSENDLNLPNYMLSFGKSRYRVAFLNAGSGERIMQSEAARRAYDELFQQDEQVIIVTQYASAGAGVNLQFRPYPDNPEIESDFTNVYLLDLPFYFFGEDFGGDGQLTRKKNVWQLAKLYHSKQISERQFKTMLGQTSGSILSQQYIQGHQTGFDAQLNRLALLIQALGRVERIWSHMPDQHVIMTPEVFSIFQSYLEDETFEGLRSRREKVNSANLTMLLNEVVRLSEERTQRANRTAERTLPATNRLCYERIAVLLQRLEQLRAGQDSEARKTWDSLRRAALRHDFEFCIGDQNEPLLRQYCMIHKTSYLRNGTIFLDDEGNLIDPELGWGQRRDLDAVYRVIRDNAVIQDHFGTRGYELGFISSAGMIFTPYAHQAILEGAVGEEAIKALLCDNLGDDALEEVPDFLFELVDLKLRGQPIFVDAKNYSELTMDQFGLGSLDYDWHPKLNSESFRQSATSKFARIHYHFGGGAKLVYLNLVSDKARGGIELYDADFSPVRVYQEAAIVIVHGALERDTPNELTHGMLVLLDHLQGSRYEKTN